MIRIKKEKFMVNESLGWKLIFLALFVIGGTGYAFYIVNSSDIHSTPALAQLEKTKLAYEAYLLSIIGAMCYLFLIGLFMLLNAEKPDKSSEETK